jgi:hypothetical protein
MNVYLAGAGVPAEYSAVPIYAKRLAGQRAPQRHRRVDDPVDADLVLFTDCHILDSADWTLRAIRSAEVAKRFPHKVCVYNERDRPWCCLPGVYISMPAPGFVSQWQVAGAYFDVDLPAARVRLDPATFEPDLLFSFVGATTHPCREDIFRLHATRSYVERTDGFLFHDPTSDRFEERRRRFAEVMLRSKFVLCPRGHATSSFRLYEALSAGRVPVILADAWVPPSGPSWNEISIRWPEARIAELPRHLEEREADAAAIGACAKDAYEQWFASDVVLTHQLNQLEGLMGTDGFAAFPRGGYKNAQYFRTLRGAALADAKRLRHSLSSRVARGQGT